MNFLQIKGFVENRTPLTVPDEMDMKHIYLYIVMRALLNALRQSSRQCLELERLGLLPGEALVGTKVAVLGSLEVDGAVQVELAHNDTRTEVKVAADDLDELSRGLVRGAVSVDIDGQRLSNTNGVGELDKGTAGKASVDQRLGDPAADVGSRTVDLGEVLAREGTTTVGTPATVGVDNDLAAGETGVTLGATNDELA